MGYERAREAVACSLIARRGRNRPAGEDLRSGEGGLFGAVRDKAGRGFDDIFHGKTPSSHAALRIPGEKEAIRLLLLLIVYTSSVTDSARIVELIARETQAAGGKCLQYGPSKPRYLDD